MFTVFQHVPFLRSYCFLFLVWVDNMCTRGRLWALGAMCTRMAFCGTFCRQNEHHTRVRLWAQCAPDKRSGGLGSTHQSKGVAICGWCNLEALQQSMTRAIPLEGQRVRVLGKALHRSHTLWVVRGLYFCQICGRVASTKPQKLLEECPRLATASGRATISALMAGRKPWGVKAWPANVQAPQRAWIALEA